MVRGVPNVLASHVCLHASLRENPLPHGRGSERHQEPISTELCTILTKPVNSKKIPGAGITGASILVGGWPHREFSDDVSLIPDRLKASAPRRE